MAAIGASKKMLIMNIYDILKTETDANHTLTQKDIIKILEEKYSMTADRKAIKRNIDDLIDFGFDICFKKQTRITKDKNGNEIKSTKTTDYYLNREFDDSELRLIIDSVLFSKNMPRKQCKELIEKIEGLSNKYFHSHVKHIYSLNDKGLQNKQLFYTIAVLDEAINENKQVEFYYNDYNINKELQPKKNKNGNEKRYIINPYQMATTNGRYYLICNLNGFDDVANYRIDRITEIKKLDKTAKPASEVKGLENGLNLSEHMSEHIYMFQDESDTVKFRVKKYLIGDVIDWFGENVKFYDETEDTVCVKAKVNIEAMRKWALQYAVHAEVLEPASLREKVIKDIKTAGENYGITK